MRKEDGAKPVLLFRSPGPVCLPVVTEGFVVTVASAAVERRIVDRPGLPVRNHGVSAAAAAIVEDLAALGRRPSITAVSEAALGVVSCGAGLQKFGKRRGRHADRRYNGDGGEFCLADHSFSPDLAADKSSMLSLPTRRR